MNEIRYPCGRNDKIEYIRARGRSNIPSSKILKLFVVRRYYITPQFVAGIKKIVTQYHFKKTDENERYLSAEEYMDISFRVMRRITRNYNKFHLLISELTEVGMTTTEIIYSYLNCDEKKNCYTRLLTINASQKQPRRIPICLLLRTTRDEIRLKCSMMKKVT